MQQIFVVIINKCTVVEYQEKELNKRENELLKN